MIRTEPVEDESDRSLLLDLGLDRESDSSPLGGASPDTGEGVLDRSSELTPRGAGASDSGRGGIGGGRSALRVGRWGLSLVMPGILLKVYEENLLDARRSNASDRPRAARVARVSGGT